MKRRDVLQDFERLAIGLDDPVPPVHVAPQVLHRIRRAQCAAERTWTFLAAGSCFAALMIALIGFSLLLPANDSMEAILDIVPPIGLQ